MRERAATPSEASDESIVRRVLQGEIHSFELLMRRYNERVYRVLRSIVRRDQEIEELMQQVYISAYARLNQFEGRARFSTWLTRIAINEGLQWMRRARDRPIAVSLEDVETMSSIRDDSRRDPEDHAAAREMIEFIERAVDELEESHRIVFMLREIEELSTAEAAECLGVSEELIRVRLHRARAQVRRSLTDRLGEVATSAFSFERPRCDRVVRRVLERISADPV